MIEKYRALFMIAVMLIEAGVLVIIFCACEPTLRRWLRRKIHEDLNRNG